MQELPELFSFGLNRRNEWTICNKCTVNSNRRKKLHTSNTGGLDKGKEEKDNTIHISNIQPASFRGPQKVYNISITRSYTLRPRQVYKQPKEKVMNEKKAMQEAHCHACQMTGFKQERETEWCSMCLELM